MSGVQAAALRRRRRRQPEMERQPAIGYQGTHHIRCTPIKGRKPPKSRTRSRPLQDAHLGACKDSHSVAVVKDACLPRDDGFDGKQRGTAWLPCSTPHLPGQLLWLAGEQGGLLPERGSTELAVHQRPSGGGARWAAQACRRGLPARKMLANWQGAAATGQTG